MKNVVIYARQSSGSNDYSDSVEAQIANCQKLAEKEGWQVIGIYRDLNSSGETYPVGSESLAEIDSAYQNWQKNQADKKAYRQGLGQVLQRLALGDINSLLVNELTRLYRPITGSYLEMYINNFLRENCITVCQYQGGDIDLSHFDQHLITTIKNQILFEDVQKKRLNSINAFKIKRDSGMKCNGAKMFGVRYLGNGKLEMIEEDIKIIQLIFDEISRYTSYLQIVRICNERFGSEKRLFYHTTIAHIARQPLYAGYQYDTNGNLIKNMQIGGQEIISLDLWNRVQNILNKKRGRKCNHGSKNWLPLSSRLICGSCGSRLVIYQSKASIYYRCNKAIIAKKNIICRKSLIRYNSIKPKSEIPFFGLFDSMYPLLIVGLIKTYEFSKALEKTTTFREEIISRLKLLAEKEKEFMTLFRGGYLAFEALNENLDNIRDEKRQLQLNLRLTETGSTLLKFKPFTSNWHILKQIAGRRLSKILVEDYVLIAELSATIHEHFVTFHSVVGDMTLPRLEDKTRKNMPNWIIEADKPLRETSPITVIYKTYSGKRELLFEYKQLKIYAE